MKSVQACRAGDYLQMISRIRHGQEIRFKAGDRVLSTHDYGRWRP